MSEIVTPDGITDAGRKLIEGKLSGRFTPEQVKNVIDTIDRESRQAMLGRGNKIADAFKRALPLVDSTSERMSSEYANLFGKQIPGDIDDLKSKLSELALKKY